MIRGIFTCRSITDLSLMTLTMQDRSRECDVHVPRSTLVQCCETIGDPLLLANSLQFRYSHTDAASDVMQLAKSVKCFLPAKVLSVIRWISVRMRTNRFVLAVAYQSYQSTQYVIADTTTLFPASSPTVGKLQV